MIAFLRKSGTLSALLLVLTFFASVAQPVLPDITGNTDRNMVVLSWTCQYDGIKSIAVLRSYDSNFNYSTIGYVKKLYKGTQAFVDGHPNPGKNFYKLSIVFNSGLTWGSNHFGVYVDSADIRSGRVLPSNEDLQKLIVTEPADKPAKPTGTPGKKITQEDRSKYEEVLPNKDTIAEVARPKLKLTFNDPADMSAYVESLTVAERKKLVLSYNADETDVTPDDALVKPGKPAPARTQPTAADAPAAPRKISLTFKDDEDVKAYIETLPEATRKKIKISSVADTTPPDAGRYVETPRKIVVRQETPQATPAAPAATPQAAPQAPRIRIAFNDDPIDNVTTSVKSRYITVNPITGHVDMNLPDDVSTHHYSIKFYDKDNHVVIDVPRINTAKLILDRRNFQKKGVYKFAIRKDILELEHGYITIY